MIKVYISITKYRCYWLIVRRNNKKGEGDWSNPLNCTESYIRSWTDPNSITVYDKRLLGKVQNMADSISTQWLLQVQPIGEIIKRGRGIDRTRKIAQSYKIMNWPKFNHCIRQTSTRKSSKHGRPYIHSMIASSSTDLEYGYTMVIPRRCWYLLGYTHPPLVVHVSDSPLSPTQ